MKKITALLLVAASLFVATVEAQAAREFKSKLFNGLTVDLMEKNISIVNEEASGEDVFPIKLTFKLDGREKDTQIVAYLTLKEEYLQNVTIDLPQSVFKKWESYYRKQMTETQFGFMPEDLKLMSVQAYESQDDPQLFYFAYSATGKYKGNWLINYLGVVYGIHIQVTGQAVEFDRDSAWAVMSAYTNCVDYALGVIEAMSGE